MRGKQPRCQIGWGYFSRLMLDLLTENLHIYLSIITHTTELLKSQFFMITYILVTPDRGLKLLNIPFSFFPYLNPTYFVISVDQLITNISSVNHKLHLCFKRVITSNILNLSLYLENKN